VEDARQQPTAVGELPVGDVLPALEQTDHVVEALAHHFCRLVDPRSELRDLTVDAVGRLRGVQLELEVGVGSARMRLARHAGCGRTLVDLQSHETVSEFAQHARVVLVDDLSFVARHRRAVDGQARRGLHRAHEFVGGERAQRTVAKEHLHLHALGAHRGAEYEAERVVEPRHVAGT